MKKETEQEKVYCIYKLTNTKNNKVYIGQTINYAKRMSQHKAAKCEKMVIHKAIQKYGWDSFTTEILHSDLTRQEANQLEVLEIQKARENGEVYNQARGGLGGAVRIEPMSEEERDKLRKRRQKKYSLVNPKGEIVEGINVSALALEIGVTRSALTKLTNGKRKSILGWTLHKK